MRCAVGEATGAAYRGHLPARAAAAHSVIEQVFTVSMDLAACVEMSDGATAIRIIEAIHRLDHVISEMRALAFDPPEESPQPIAVEDLACS